MRARNRPVFMHLVLGGLVLTLVAGSAFAARAWKTYRAEKHGFEMSVPPATKMIAAEWDDGWAGFHGKLGVVKIWGITKLDAKVAPAVIETFGVLVTGIPFRFWKVLKEGTGEKGFEWYKTAMAEKGNHMVLAGYGVGPRGSYLILLKTLKTNYVKNKAAYDRFADSIKVF